MCFEHCKHALFTDECIYYFEFKGFFPWLGKKNCLSKRKKNRFEFNDKNWKWVKQSVNFAPQDILRFSMWTIADSTVSAVSGSGQFIGFTQQNPNNKNKHRFVFTLMFVLSHVRTHTDNTASFWLLRSAHFRKRNRIDDDNIIESLFHCNSRDHSQYSQVISTRIAVLSIYFVCKIQQFNNFFSGFFLFGFSRQNISKNTKNKKGIPKEKLTIIMCVRCHPQSRKYWVFGCGTFFTLFAILVGLLWPGIANYALRMVSGLKCNQLIIEFQSALKWDSIWATSVFCGDRKLHRQ